MTKNELFNFYDITTVNKEKETISLSYFFEASGADPLVQVEKIEKHPFLNTYVSLKKDELITTKKGFLIYVLSLLPNETTILTNEQVLLYQEFIADYLYDDSIKREQLTRDKLIISEKLKQIELEISEDEKFIRHSQLKEQLKMAETTVKQLNSRLVSKMQGTIDFDNLPE